MREPLLDAESSSDSKVPLVSAAHTVSESAAESEFVPVAVPRDGRRMSFGVLDTPSHGKPLGETLLTRSEVLLSARTMQVLKPLNPSRFRWNLLWLALILLMIFLPVWLPYTPAGCGAAFVTIGAVFAWFDTIWLLAIVFSLWYLRKMKRGMDTDYRLLYPPQTTLYHIIILTIYKDPMVCVLSRGTCNRSHPHS
jgi:hypothetical protein